MQKAEAEDMDIDDNDAAKCSAPPASSMTPRECCIVINNLADLLQHFGIRDQPDVVRAVVETLAHVTRHCSAGVSHVAFCLHMIALHSAYVFVLLQLHHHGSKTIAVS